MCPVDCWPGSNCTDLADCLEDWGTEHWKKWTMVVQTGCGGSDWLVFLPEAVDVKAWLSSGCCLCGLQLNELLHPLVVLDLAESIILTVDCSRCYHLWPQKWPQNVTHSPLALMRSVVHFPLTCQDKSISVIQSAAVQPLCFQCPDLDKDLHDLQIISVSIDKGIQWL